MSYLSLTWSSQRLPAAGRPEAVGWWIKRHRKYGIIPPIDDVPAFSTQYIIWWGKMRTDTKDVLRVGGTNGFLSVMLLLRWWGELLMSDNIKSDVGDVALEEETGIWYEYVDRAREVLASFLGRPYDCRTDRVHNPVVSNASTKKRSSDIAASPRGTYRLSNAS